MQSWGPTHIFDSLLPPAGGGKGGGKSTHLGLHKSDDWLAAEKRGGEKRGKRGGEVEEI